MAPPDIVHRIDDFLRTFRESLEGMAESEIRDHADSLSTKLLKPIQKLQSEASLQYSRIERYGPEVFHPSNYDSRENIQAIGSSDAGGIPWNTTEALASTIRGLRREDLLNAFDRMTHPSTRSRVISCVYGSKFPLKKGSDHVKTSFENNSYSTNFLSILQGKLRYPKAINKTTKIIDNFSQLLKHRTALPNFNPTEHKFNSN